MRDKGVAAVVTDRTERRVCAECGTHVTMFEIRITTGRAAGMRVWCVPVHEDHRECPPGGGGPCKHVKCTSNRARPLEQA